MAHGKTKLPRGVKKQPKLKTIDAFDETHFGKDSVGFTLLNESCDKFEKYENLQHELPFSNLNEMEEETDPEIDEDDETASTLSGYKTLEDHDESDTDEILDLEGFQSKYDEETQKIKDRFVKKHTISHSLTLYDTLEILSEEAYLPE